ncbi:MAG: hypothetical protein IJ882_06860, partial [Paludibacteraceae bacterium]|nr:hypothetical protein [Paludibacteraceae bacterium]
LYKNLHGLMYGFARLLSAWLVPFRFQKRNNPFRCKGTAIFRHTQKKVQYFIKYCTLVPIFWFSP